ncbi:hypothetical protein B0H17DRAFT_1212376 [Mycena rosella]|uniref:Uncharacterized protein n=1 Tax=Mycena rosella TaxID=1033263 RepID=A0AAD7CSM1_MYCRO|nr:hypothetical protein B0H17DRAFT_1212376 [Mycena rosella]
MDAIAPFDPDDFVTLLSSVGRFDTVHEYQLQRAVDLMVFNPDLGFLVRVLWPTHFGIRMKPKDLVAFLLCQNLYLPCFCSEHTDGCNYACEFTVVSETSKVYAYCHFNPPRCGYFVDLQRIYQESVLELEYPSVIVNEAPYTGKSLVSHYFSGHPDFRVSEDWSPDVPMIFHGYLGEVNPAVVTEATTTHVKKMVCTHLQPGQSGPKHLLPFSPQTELVEPQRSVSQNENESVDANTCTVVEQGQQKRRKRRLRK